VAYGQDGRVREGIPLIEHVVKMKRKTLAETDRSRLVSETALEWLRAIQKEE
jgi:hypothetical protein